MGTPRAQATTESQKEEVKHAAETPAITVPSFSPMSHDFMHVVIDDMFESINLAKELGDPSLDRLIGIWSRIFERLSKIQMTQHDNLLKLYDEIQPLTTAEFNTNVVVTEEDLKRIHDQFPTIGSSEIETEKKKGEAPNSLRDKLAILHSENHSIEPLLRSARSHSIFRPAALIKVNISRPMDTDSPTPPNSPSATR